MQKQQSIAMVDTETDEFTEKTLSHEGNEVREFYAALDQWWWASKPPEPCDYHAGFQHIASVDTDTCELHY